MSCHPRTRRVACYTIEGRVAQIRAWGPWAALGPIVLMVVHSFLPFPAEIITPANGRVFGSVWGTVITRVWALLGAALVLAWVLARLRSAAAKRRQFEKN